jgi:uncharacterized lipoprotein YajG
MKYISVVLITSMLLLAGCSTFPGTTIGNKLAKMTLENQKAFADTVAVNAKSIDCAAGYSIGANLYKADNAKIKMATIELLRLVDVNGQEYKDCYKFGIFSAYMGADAELTLMRILEKVGWIN